MSIQSNLSELAERWTDVDPAERANAQLYLTELAEALDVPRPGPRGSGYEFELPIRVVTRDGSETTQFADLFKEGCFLLEAKDQEADRSDDILLRRAYGQVRGYVTHVPGPTPPYLMVLDVGRELLLWDRWDGSYGGFKAARRIDLPALNEFPGDIALLRDVWTDPESRNPRQSANAVTQEIAEHLADLASRLEKEGHDQERVARFLIRCVFTMFAEDVGLLKDEPFLRAIRDFGMENPDEFRRAVADLWEAMDRGGRFGLYQLLEFDGHFFHDQEVLPIDREALAVLLEAARADWRYVEPSIMGTLLVRALDPEERHRLGAQFTPREYVERLVRPTIEEPLREEWTLVEAEVLQLREKGRKKDQKLALARLRDFHDRLRNLRVLDPACGSGNFLYVALETVKKIELEVLNTIEELTGQPEMAVEEVGPWQFLGIEVKPWSREIAELTLWIGYHQFWMEHHGHTMPPEPVLRDSGNLQLRDAVLDWEEVEEDPERARPDPTPKKEHPVTGKLVPDPRQRLPYLEYKGAKPAKWPEVDFIIGNPPYMGRGRQRSEFGDGYVDALRRAYPEVNENSDYVMYWWHKAALAVADGKALRAGLITTNSITQKHNREAISKAAEIGADVVWAIRDHPWVDETGEADVRIAMTVLEKDGSSATLVRASDDGRVHRRIHVESVNDDLTAHVDVVGAAEEPLQANEGISSQGFILVGADGFVLEGDEARRLMSQDPPSSDLVRPYMTGRDLSQKRRDQFVIDFGLRDEEEAKQYTVLYDLIRDRVKPMRDSNPRSSYRKYWWRFGEPRSSFRPALEDLDRYIATVETAKHRIFTFLPAEVATSHKIICIALDDPFFLGVLSSTIHVTWADSAGGRLGAGNDPVYTKSSCFDPFPFPKLNQDQNQRATELGRRLYRHRTEALSRSHEVTLTGMYNVLDKLRAGEDLTEKERRIHEVAACRTLLEIHEKLDAAVAQCYGWPWPLEKEEVLDRLVRLHDARIREEEQGKVRWLRPAYQVPKFGTGIEPEEDLDLGLETEEDVADIGPAPWPETTVDQIAALKTAVQNAPGDAKDLRMRFKGASRSLIERHLETLEIVGEVQRGDDGQYRAPVPIEEVP